MIFLIFNFHLVVFESRSQSQVQHALGRAEKSLTTFTRALEANKNDPLCKFHRASVLFGIGRLDESLEELEELKEIVPKESLVYFLIAKVRVSMNHLTQRKRSCDAATE